MNNTRDTMRELRKRISGSDTFMSGHQISKIRGRRRLVPAWTKDNAKVQEVLLRAFPLLSTNPTQHRRAARWARVIHLYFRMQASRGSVAFDLKTTDNTIRDTITRILRASRGLSCNGTARKPPKSNN